MPVIPGNGHRQSFAAGLADFLTREERPVDAEATVVEELEPVPARLEGAFSHVLFITQPENVLLNLLLRDPVRPNVVVILQLHDRADIGLLRTAGETGKLHVADHALAQWRNLMLRLRLCDLTSLLAFTRYRRGVTIEQMIEKLNRYVIGWRGYFGYRQSRSVLRVLDSWIRHRLRCVYWRRLKRGTKRFAELRKLDVGKELAARTAGSVHGPWRLSRSPALSYAFPNTHFNRLGLALLAERGTA